MAGNWGIVALLLAACGQTAGGPPEPVTPPTALPGPSDPVRDGVWTAIGAGLGDGALVSALRAGHSPLLEFSAPRNQLSSKGLEALLTSDRCAGLRRLNLSSNPLGDQGLQVLVEHWPESLGELHLADVGATAQGVQKLVQKNPRLELLVLGYNALGEDGAASLVQLTSVGRLSLERAALGPRGLLRLVEGAQVPALTLVDNAGGAGSLAQLRGIAPSLMHLDLRQNGLSGADLEALTRWKAPALRELYLDIPDIDEGIVQGLPLAPWFGQLHALSLGADRASPAARRGLIAAWEAGGRDGRGLDVQRRDL